MRPSMIYILMTLYGMNAKSVQNNVFEHTYIIRIMYYV